jgi:hypothetical protein
MGRYDDPAYASGSTLASTDKLVWSTAAGTMVRTAQQTAHSLARLGELVFNVREYGAVADSSTDNAAAFQAAIDACAAAGGGTVLVPGAPLYYVIQSAVTISTENITLRGAGGDISHNVGAPAGATSTKLYTNFAGYPINFESPTPGGAAEQKIKVGGMVGFFINGGDAGKGLRIRSVNNGIFEDLAFAYCNTSCIDLNCVAIDDPPDNQYNVFRNITLRCHDAADTGLHGIILDGASGGNTSINTFERILAYHKNGDAIKVLNADNNTFRDIFTYRVTGTGYAMSFHGSATLANVARENIVDNLSCDSAARFYGTGTYTYPAQNNFIALDNGNSAVYPTIDAGAITNRFDHRYKPDMQSVAYATTITPFPYFGETINVGTLTGNVAIDAPTGSVHYGKRMTFILTQDGTGGRTMTFAAAYKKIATLSTTASKINSITFQYNGTDWVEIAASVGI